MGVAQLLDVDDVKVGLLAQAGEQWSRWCRSQPGLAPVPSLLELRRWLRQADPGEWDQVLGALVVLADAGRIEDDATAATAALAWALLPGAIRIAQSLRTLSPEIDQLVASQLWIEIRSSAMIQRKIAPHILWRTRSAVMLECDGRAQLERSEKTRALARTVPMDPHLLSSVTESPEEPGPLEEDPAKELWALLEWACERELITTPERALLVSLVAAVDQVKGTRGKDKAGLLGVQVSERVANEWGIGASTVRRRVGRTIETLAGAATLRTHAA